MNKADKKRPYSTAIRYKLNSSSPPPVNPLYRSARMKRHVLVLIAVTMVVCCSKNVFPNPYSGFEHTSAMLISMSLGNYITLHFR